MAMDEQSKKYPVSASNASPKELSTLSDFIASLDSHISDAHDILARVDKLADRIGGSVPHDASAEGQSTPEEVALNLRLRRKLSQLGNLHYAVMGELSRLENAV